eukprot:GEMP01108139.1.p1 GENE.GEMP01108139.1~~GEMP01108139.1.p1  ORF type:complete len:124 (+),score=27.90 GEMP01108139.1:112-483(+)
MLVLLVISVFARLQASKDASSPIAVDAAHVEHLHLPVAESLAAFFSRFTNPPKRDKELYEGEWRHEWRSGDYPGFRETAKGLADYQSAKPKQKADRISLLWLWACVIVVGVVGGVLAWHNSAG